MPTCLSADRAKKAIEMFVDNSRHASSQSRHVSSHHFHHSTIRKPYYSTKPASHIARPSLSTAVDTATQPVPHDVSHTWDTGTQPAPHGTSHTWDTGSFKYQYQRTPTWRVDTQIHSNLLSPFLFSLKVKDDVKEDRRQYTDDITHNMDGDVVGVHQICGGK